MEIFFTDSDEPTCQASNPMRKIVRGGNLLGSHLHIQLPSLAVMFCG